MTIPTRKYLICEYQNGLGKRFFTLHERRSFLGIGCWSDHSGFNKNYDTMEELTKFATWLSEYHASQTTTLISRKEVDL